MTISYLSLPSQAWQRYLITKRHAPQRIEAASGAGTGQLPQQNFYVLVSLFTEFGEEDMLFGKLGLILFFTIIALMEFLIASCRDDKSFH
jgi:hypothetical protein